MKITIINGPNLNLLGIRNPDIYGSESLEDIKIWIKNHKSSASCTLCFEQSNYEGKIIDLIHDTINSADAIVINAGALSHYSIAIRDALELTNLPVVEVHLSDISSREDFRKKSVLSDICVGQFTGQGKLGYILAIELLQGIND